jgi:hypothetical protein
MSDYFNSVNRKFFIMMLLITTFNDGRDHFEPLVGFYGIFGMGGDNNGLSGLQGL